VGRPDLSFGIYEHDLNHAYVEVGRHADAAELTERFAALAEASALSTAHAALAYMRAVLAADEEVDQRFAAAVELARLQPFLHVRVLTLWGQRLARLGHASDAEARWQAGREIADVIGAAAVAQWVGNATVSTTEPHLARRDGARLQGRAYRALPRRRSRVGRRRRGNFYLPRLHCFAETALATPAAHRA
jgi:hypothetical protein